MAPMKDTKPPTVMLRPPLLWPWYSAMPMTTDSATAAAICASGIAAAEALVALIDRPRSLPLSRSKRAACCGCAPCRRTMRWASTFSSTT